MTTSAKPAKKPIKGSLIESIFGKKVSELQQAVIVEKGLPTDSINVLRDEGLTFSEVHGIILPARTLKHRRQKKQPLSMEETDRTIRICKAITLADKVFGNRDKALGWLRRANPRLEGRAPLELLKSEVGGELVRQMLFQIDEGIFV